MKKWLKGNSIICLLWMLLLFFTICGNLGGFLLEVIRHGGAGNSTLLMLWTGLTCWYTKQWLGLVKKQCREYDEEERSDGLERIAEEVTGRLTDETVTMTTGTERQERIRRLSRIITEQAEAFDNEVSDFPGLILTGQDDDDTRRYDLTRIEEYPAAGRRHVTTSVPIQGRPTAVSINMERLRRDILTGAANSTDWLESVREAQEELQRGSDEEMRNFHERKMRALAENEKTEVVRFIKKPAKRIVKRRNKDR